MSREPREGPPAFEPVQPDPAGWLADPYTEELISRESRWSLASQIVGHLAAEGLSSRRTFGDDWAYSPRQAIDKFTDGTRWYIP